MTTETAPADSPAAHRSRGPARRWVRARPADVIDVFVYVVVLNLFVEYLPQVLSETFTLSLLTAVLLKGVLEVVLVATLQAFIFSTLTAIYIGGATAESH